MSPVFGHGRLRLYLLKLLDESPRHGYDVIRGLEDRFLGLYAPSAGTVYPRLARLETEGLVEHSDAEGRKVFRITEAGRRELAARRDELDDLEAEIAGSVHDLAREIRSEVHGSAADLRAELKTARAVRRQARHVSRAARERPRGAPTDDAMGADELVRLAEGLRATVLETVRRDESAGVGLSAADLAAARAVLEDATTEVRRLLGRGVT